MRIRFRMSASVIGVTLALVLAAAPAFAGQPPILKVAKHESGPYSTNVKINVGPEEKTDFFLKARSPSVAVPGTLFHIDSSMPLYKSKYIRGDRNITDDVKSAEGFAFTLKPKAKKFRAVVKDIGNGPDGDCIGVKLEDPSLSAQILVGINVTCF